MLTEFTTWLLTLIKAAFGALGDLLYDTFVTVLDGVLSAVNALLSGIPVPEFLSQGLQTLWGQLDGGVMFLLTAVGLPTALAMLGAAYMFRLGRKVVTLFQW